MSCWFAVPVSLLIPECMDVSTAAQNWGRPTLDVRKLSMRRTSMISSMKAYSNIAMMVDSQQRGVASSLCEILFAKRTCIFK